MAKQIHLKKVLDFFDKSPVVEFKSIERIICANKKTNYPKLLISNLIRKKSIYKLGKGIYTKYPESSLAVFAFKPAYLGLQSALSFHGVWEQETIPVIITTKKTRRGIRQVMNSNILLRNIDKKHFFGFEFYKDGAFYLPYSDLEKTFMDMVVFNQKMSEEVLNVIKKRINKTKFNNYLQKYPKNIRNRIENEIN